MSNYYSDPTANAAIGSIDREIKRLEKVDKALRELKAKGYITEQDDIRLRKSFKGIFNHIFD